MIKKLIVILLSLTILGGFLVLPNSIVADDKDIAGHFVSDDTGPGWTNKLALIGVGEVQAYCIEAWENTPGSGLPYTFLQELGQSNRITAIIGMGHYRGFHPGTIQWALNNLQGGDREKLFDDEPVNPYDSAYDIPEGWECHVYSYRVAEGFDRVQDLAWGTCAPPPKAKVKVNKGIIENNHAHSHPIVGAEYTIYKDEALTQEVGKFIIDENHTSEFIEVDASQSGVTYYIKETKAPDFYKLDETVYTVQAISQQEHVIEVKDEIGVINLTLVKEGTDVVPVGAVLDIYINGVLYDNWTITEDSNTYLIEDLLRGSELTIIESYCPEGFVKIEDKKLIVE